MDSSFLNTDISFISDPLPKIDAEVVNQIFKAIKSRCVVSFAYKSSGSKIFKEKVFDCYHVVCQKGNWYVLGFDHGTADFRVFALSQIKNIVPSGKSFSVPKDFDIHRHIDLNFGIWNNPEPPEEYEFLFPQKWRTMSLSANGTKISWSLSTRTARFFLNSARTKKRWCFPGRWASAIPSQ